MAVYQGGICRIQCFWGLTHTMCVKGKVNPDLHLFWWYTFSHTQCVCVKMCEIWAKNTKQKISFRQLIVIIFSWHLVNCKKGTWFKSHSLKVCYTIIKEEKGWVEIKAAAVCWFICNYLVIMKWYFQLTLSKWSESLYLWFFTVGRTKQATD